MVGQPRPPLPLDDLERALREEADALVAGDADRLHAAAACKVDLLAQIKVAWRAAAPGERRRCALALQAARSRHEAHAGVLALRMAMARAQLDTLLGRGEALLYAPDGAFAPRLPAGARELA